MTCKLLDNLDYLTVNQYRVVFRYNKPPCYGELKYSAPMRWSFLY